MIAAMRKLNPRQWALILVLIPVAVLFFQKRVAGMVRSLPTARAIEAEREVLRERREKHDALQAKLDARESELASLREQTAPFWRVDDRNPARQKGIVQNEVNRLLSKANIRGVDYQVINPRRLDLPDKTLVYEVEVTVNMTASMREIARVLAEVDRSEQRLTWSQCSIAPLNLRDTSKVRLTGTLRALVLSPDAVELLAGTTEARP
jgi:Sec-independent protein translocase protein TatA